MEFRRVLFLEKAVLPLDQLLPKIGELPFVHERLFSRWPVIRWKLYVVERPLFVFRSYIRCSVNIGHSKLPPQVHCPLIPCDIRSRSEEHTSELQSLMRTSYAVSCLKKKKT